MELELGWHEADEHLSSTVYIACGSVTQPEARVAGRHGCRNHSTHTNSVAIRFGFPSLQTELRKCS